MCERESGRESERVSERVRVRESDRERDGDRDREKERQRRSRRVHVTFDWTEKCKCTNGPINNLQTLLMQGI